MRRLTEFVHWLPFGGLVYIVAFRFAPRSLWGEWYSSYIDYALMTVCLLGIPALILALAKARHLKSARESTAYTLLFFFGLTLDMAVYFVVHLKRGTPYVDPASCSRDDYADYMLRIDQCRGRDWGLLAANQHALAIKGPAKVAVCKAFAAAHARPVPKAAPKPGDQNDIVRDRVTQCGQPSQWTKVPCPDIALAFESTCYRCESGLDPHTFDALEFSADCSKVGFYRTQGMDIRKATAQYGGR
jgi:hypothetical protein